MGKSTATIEELELRVRSGELAKAARILRDTGTRSIARSDLCRYAQIANRVGKAEFTLRLLHPIVRSDSPLITRPSDNEKLEYAAALRLKGIFREAITLLEEIDRAQMPVVNMRIASCLMSQWKYGEAIPYLREYVAATDAKEYANVIGRVNLAAALVVENQDEEASRLLTALIADTEQAGHSLLRGNSMELMAQLLIRAKKFDQAEEMLSEAKLMFSGNARYELYLRKWHAVAQSLKSGKVHPSLLACRAEAQTQMEWETVRDCDLYVGAIKQDHALLNHIYVGTPYASYRNRIRALAGAGFEPVSRLIWTADRDAVPLKFFDVLKGQGDGSSETLDRGRLMHRTLMHLSADFYRPVTLLSAFAEMFPGENFSQEGRAERVHQSIRRLREWFKAQGFPIAIDHTQGHYRLKFSPEIGLIVESKKPELFHTSVSWEKFKSQFRDNRFNKQDVMSVLGCSSATAKRLLSWAVKSGRVHVIGAGTRREYLTNAA